MARAGLYKSDVQKARDALLAQRKKPSVDAVRVALGNTGSKTTIHRYLRELEGEEGGGPARTVAVSDALQDLVARLASRLQEEAEAILTQERERHQAELHSRQQALSGARSEEHTSELQSQSNLVCRLLLEKKKKVRDNLRQRPDICVSVEAPYC